MNSSDEEALARLEAQAALVGLAIEPLHRAGTLDNLQRLTAMARLFMDFPLPAEMEAAPVFSPSLPDATR